MRLGLSLAIALLVVSPALGEIPRPDEDIHLVIARTDGTHVSAQLPLTEQQAGEVRHIWAWTKRLPPRKIDIEAVALERTKIVRELERAAARPLEVRVRGWSRPEEVASLRIIAAPLEMWGSVPEALLPSFAVSREGRATIQVRDPVRIRITGKGKGTAWQQPGLAKAVDVPLRDASDAALTLQTNDGSPLLRAFATVTSIRSGDASPVLQAQFAADDRGRIEIPALPTGEILTLVLTGEGSAPRKISGTAAELTRTLRLEPGAKVKGTFVDDDDEPIEGVRVETEGWISPDVAALAGNRTTSDEKGQWTVEGLPRVRIIVRASSEGRSTLRKEVSLEDGDADLGVVTLMRAEAVTLTVLDAENRPIRKVLVTSDSGFKGRTNDKGTIAVTGLAADQPASIRLTADRFAAQTVLLSPPLPKREQVVLERAFTVTGAVADDRGVPIADAIAIITIGSRYRREAITPDGAFSLDIETGRDFDLTFESTATASFVTKQPSGRSGEVRDLGTIRMPAGTIVRGRIVDRAAAPVGGARIWAIRPNVAGAVAAWVAGRTVQATSDVDGAFELRGVPSGATLLRIDAPDYARAYRNVVIADSQLDVGVIEIVRGSTVTVQSRHDDAVARLDLRGEWLDADMLAAPVVYGEARLRNVPPGEYRVSVMNGRTLVCDRRVTVEESTGALVECPGPMTVRGRVLLDGNPAYGGSLAFSQIIPTDALINTRMSPAGARQERVYGSGGGTIMVAVGSDGMFETDQLIAGEWQVVWRSPDNATSPSRSVTVSDVSNAPILVEFAGGMIRGRVVDARQQPVAHARIREIQGPLFAMSASDGSFTLTGVGPGTHRLQAAIGSRASAVVDVLTETGKAPAEVVIELDDAERNVLMIRVIGVAGEPKPNAFVFVEAVGGIRIFTADADGVARGAFPAGLPDGARLVAFADNAWAFATLKRSGAEDDPQNATIPFVKTGVLTIRSRTSTGAPAVQNLQAGDLTWMLGRVGYAIFVTPDSPLIIHGLPPAVYSVALGAAVTNVSVRAGETVNADLP